MKHALAPSHKPLSFAPGTANWLQGGTPKCLPRPKCLSARQLTSRLHLGGVQRHALPLAAAGPHNEQGYDGKAFHLQNAQGMVQGYETELSDDLSTSLAHAAAAGGGPVSVLSREDLERLARMDGILLPADANVQAASSNGGAAGYPYSLHADQSLGSGYGNNGHGPAGRALGSGINGVSAHTVHSSLNGAAHSSLAGLDAPSDSAGRGASGAPPLPSPGGVVNANGVHLQQFHGPRQPPVTLAESPQRGMSSHAVHEDSLQGSHASQCSSIRGGDGDSSSSLFPRSQQCSEAGSLPSSSSAGGSIQGAGCNTSSSSTSDTGPPPWGDPSLPSPPPTSAGPSSSDPALPAASTTGTDPTPHPNLGRPGHIPKSILVISIVSGTLTMASCVFNTLLPIYMVTELRMSMRSMGMFEGVLEAFSYVVRMFSGVVSDMMTSRKSAITLGFAMGACAKFGMSSAATVGQLFASKAVDRLANGVQAAPRDALISDLAPKQSRSACYGFAQSMRKWGSFVGAGLSFFLMKASNNNYKLIFMMAAVVSVASTLAFVTLVPSHAREQEVKETRGNSQAAEQAAGTAAMADGKAANGTNEARQPGFQLGQFCKDVLSMGSDFYRTLAVICLYGLGHINESMLEARAIEVGFGKAESTLVVALLALMIFFCAYPLGRLDDKYGPRVTFAVGMGALILGNLTLLMSGTYPMALFGSLMFLGVHWAVIQGPMLSIVVGLAPAHLRGTAFGIFYTVMACTAVTANTMFGSVWTAMGANAVFGLSASLMALSLLALPSLLPATTQKPVMARA